MNLIKKINKFSSRALMTLLAICLFQLLIKYAFLSPKIQTNLKNQHFVISTIDKSTINEVYVEGKNLKITLLKLKAGWSLVFPRKYPANALFLNNFIDQLLSIKIKDVLNKDLINISNYSLEKPSYKITLKNKSQSYMFTFGFINTILNSTYLLLTDQNVIYKTSIPNLLTQNLSFSNFINTKIFTYDPQKIKSFKIFYGNNQNKKLALSLNLKNKTWVGKKNRILASSKVTQRLNEIFNIRSKLIFDTIAPEQEKIINKRLKFPRYTLIIRIGKKDFKYKISYLLPNIKQLKIKANEFFVISSEHSFSYLVRKKFMKSFDKRESSLRALDLKKLFY